jgi:hypothetical protein
MLLVFTQDGVPTWEVSRRAKVGSGRDDLVANGTADTFEAAKAAALFEARARSYGKRARGEAQLRCCCSGFPGL